MIELVPHEEQNRKGSIANSVRGRLLKLYLCSYMPKCRRRLQQKTAVGMNGTDEACLVTDSGCAQKAPLLKFLYRELAPGADIRHSTSRKDRAGYLPLPGIGKGALLGCLNTCMASWGWPDRDATVFSSTHAVISFFNTHI